jgi:hypothetical protein
VALGHAQNTWIKTYGGYHTEEGFDVQQTADGGYIIVGTTCSYGQGYSSVYLIKTDTKGDTDWTKTFGGSKSDGGFGVQQTNDQGYIVTGYIRADNPIRSIYLIKTNINGDTLWTRLHCGDIAAIGRSVEQTLDGGYVVAGYSQLGGVLIKTDIIGDTLWTRVFNDTILYRAYDVQQTVDGGYILTGERKGLAALVKTDPLGRIEWTNYFGAKRLDRGYSVRQTTDGGYIVTGIQYIPGGHESASRVFLIKTDASGDTLWTRKLGDGYSAGNCVRQTEDEGYIITGYIIGEYGVWYIYLMKTDHQGQPIWTKIFDEGVGHAVRQTSDSGYVITGYTSISGKGDEVILIKTDSNGDITGINNKHNHQSILPTDFKLYQNTPNPFNQSTNINYEIINNTQDIKLTIFDLMGKEVITLVDEVQSPGIHSVLWNGKDKKGGDAPSGMYFCRLWLFTEANTTFTDSKKMVVIK